MLSAPITENSALLHHDVDFAGDSSGEDDEEEEYMSSGSSSSDDEDDAGADGAAAEPDEAAKQHALEEARAMLADRPRSKKKHSNAWFEEEVALALSLCLLIQ